MIGLICASLVFVTALLVTLRHRPHWPLCAALGMSTLYAGAFNLDRWLRPDDPSPHATLALFACVALASGLAYLRVWAWEPGETSGLLASIAILIGAGVVRGDALGWQMATWGPFAVSSVMGGLALWRWLGSWGNDPPTYRATYDGRDIMDPPRNLWTITTRIALILLVSDVAMLLFIPWPGVQMWQGRMSALVVAGMQAMWFVRQTPLRTIWTRYGSLRAIGKPRLFSLRIAWLLRDLPSGKRDTSHVYRGMFGE